MRSPHTSPPAALADQGMTHAENNLQGRTVRFPAQRFALLFGDELRARLVAGEAKEASDE